MSRDKQIEEMAKTMCFQADSCTVKSCVQVNCEKTWLAEALYNAGYCKSADVAREIFEQVLTAVDKRIEEIEMRCKRECYYPGHSEYEFLRFLKKYLSELKAEIAELKKKYTEVDRNTRRKRNDRD